MTLTHRPAYYVESHFFVSDWFGASESELRVVYAMAQSADDQSNLGFYRRGSGELCPLVYEDCTWNPEVTNEIEFREAAREGVSGLLVYPNPSTGKTHIVVPTGSIINAVWLTGLNGQRLYYGVSVDSGAIELDLSGQPPGIYALQVLMSDGALLNAKIVLQTRP